MQTTRGDDAGTTAQLARWVAALTFDDLPEGVREHVARMVLDYCAAVSAGAVSPEAAAARTLAERTYAPGDCSVVGSPRRLNAPGAAFANGTAAHSMELDDGYTPGSVHPGAVVVSAALAVAQEVGADAAAFTLAVGAGVEVTCRVAAAGHPLTLRRGFHNTGIAGVFGASVAASKLRRFGAVDVASCLGVAGSHSSGLFEFLNSGGSIKRVHAGKAARDGVISADLVRAGIDGPPTVLEGPRGYFHAFAGPTADPEQVTAELGHRWSSLRTYVKPYPCCRHLHSTVDALEVALGSTSGPVSPAEVERVLVETYEVAAGHAVPDARTVLSAQLSIPFAVASRLCFGQVTVEEFGEERRTHPDIAVIMARTEVRTAVDLEATYPRQRPARVTVSFADGSVRTAQVGQPYGEPDAPLSASSLEAKVRECAIPLLGEEGVADLIGAVHVGDPSAIATLLQGPATAMTVDAAAPVERGSR